MPQRDPQNRQVHLIQIGQGDAGSGFRRRSVSDLLAQAQAQDMRKSRVDRDNVAVSPVMVLTLLIIVTMTLSDVMNNTATAVIAAPIAVEIAGRLDANPDSFLMGVAVAASCAFLTPIGHKNNTLIMGPGGYQFDRTARPELVCLHQSGSRGRLRAWSY